MADGGERFGAHTREEAGVVVILNPDSFVNSTFIVLLDALDTHM